MKNTHQTILEIIKNYLEENPEQRFGQALFNLRINEFKELSNPNEPQYVVRDIHNDNDEDIINRIHSQLKWYELQKRVNLIEIDLDEIAGMTVNERLHMTGLLETFNELKNKETKQAEFILRRLKVDEESIKSIINEAK